MVQLCHKLENKVKKVIITTAAIDMHDTATKWYAKPLEKYPFIIIE